MADARAMLNVLTTIAMKGVLERLAAPFARQAGCRLTMTFAPGGVALERIRAGHMHDVVISGPSVLDALASQGYLVVGSKVELAHSRMGVAILAGAPRPRVDTVESFKCALKEAKSVTYTDPATGAASGVHLAKVLEGLGIAEDVRAKAKLGSGGPVAEFLVRGEATLAVQQICEHMLVAGVDIVGPLPPALQTVSTVAIALHTRTPVPDAGQTLIALLQSARGRECLIECGLEPLN